MNVGYSLPIKGAGYDYDQALTTLMVHFYPSGMLGLGITALMASFMSGMAGNVTAFNTVFTYDLYQSYMRRERARRSLSARRALDHAGRRGALDRGRLPGAALQQHHGRAAVGVLLRERAAVRHVPTGHVLEAHHGPRRVLRACLRAPEPRRRVHGLTDRRRQRRLDHERCMQFPSTMAQNFWMAIFAWSTCFVVTLLVSLATRRAPGGGIARPGLQPDARVIDAQDALVPAARRAGLYRWSLRASF